MEIMDWSQFAVMTNQITGKRATLEDDELAALLAPSYAYGIRGVTTSTGTTIVNGGGEVGAIRVGPYPEADFGSLLGVT